MRVFETIFYCMLIFAGGCLFGASFRMHNMTPDEPNRNMKELSFCEDCDGYAKMERLNKADLYITDLLLTELVTALKLEYIELPSFGTVPLNSPDSLRAVFWRCVESDELVNSRK